MYLLKHLPPHLQKRWTDQLALQHDVDIKRLWRRSPQTLDTMVGTPPLDANMEFPEEQFSSSSGASSSSSSSPVSSSESPGVLCPRCVNLEISGMTGDEAVFNGTWHLEGTHASDVPCDEDATLTFLKVATVEQSSGDISVNLNVWYYPTEDRWVFYGQSDFAFGQANFTSPFGVGRTWSGSMEFEWGGDGASTGSVSMTTSTDCPESSSGVGSSGSGLGSSSSDPGSGSGSGSSSDLTSSGGGGSGSAPDDSSSSFGSAGFPWEGSASSGGDQDSGRGSDFGGEFDCYTVQCAIWEWQGSGWRRTYYAFIACPEVCRTDCSERPQQAGYVGLKARVTCDGTIYYYED